MKTARLLLCATLLAALPAVASAATLSLGGTTSAHVGDTISIPVYLSTAAGESANAVSGTISYPTSLLTLVAVSKAGSIISLWPSDPSGGGGSATFEGVILNPGYSGARGTVMTLTFQAKAAGNASVAFGDASVLANDGNATPILTGTTPTIIAIAAPVPQTAPPAQTTPQEPVQQKPQAPAPAATTTPVVQLATTAVQEPVVQGDLLSEAYQFTVNNGPLVALSIALMLAVVLLVRFLLWYPFIPIGRARRVRKDITAGLHERFDELREAVTQEVFVLEHAKSKRELTAEEERFLIRFQKLLTKAERDIEKEIS